MTAILWLRRDLRLRDHPALEAARRGDRMIPVFCFDDGLLRGRHASGPRTQFLLECLAELDRDLRVRGSRLFVRHGRPEEELAALARETGAETVHMSADVSPFARARDARVKAALGEGEVELVAHPGMFVLDALEPLRTGANNPYTVFTPFYRKWQGEDRRAVSAAPRTLPATGRGARAGRLPTLKSLGLTQEVSDPAPGGESAARAALSAYLKGPIDGYADAHDALADDGTSRLSPYLHFGCLSPREIEERLGRGRGAQEFRRQLAWRDFYAHVLGHFPDNARCEYQERYRSLRWSHAQQRFDRWRAGETGFPVVDAGMRQLAREGWLHNRARLIVGSFLTKDLGIDWRWGERHFMRLLIDGDEASNNGNWQWIASVGVDPAPAFQRMFNPTLQMKKFDPEGRYVRTYVPELREVPDEYLREPWTMPDEVQRDCGCRIGEDYPEPIVEHKRAREEALERYRR